MERLRDEFRRQSVGMIRRFSEAESIEINSLLEEQSTLEDSSHIKRKTR